MSDLARHQYTLGQTVVAVVDEIFPFGIFVRVDGDTPAYIRQRELTLAGNVDPRLAVSEGEELQAVVIAPVEPGRQLELSVRQAKPDPWEIFATQFDERQTITGTVKWVAARGVVIEAMPGVDGFISVHELAPWPVERPDELLWIGDEVQAMITHLDPQNKRLRLSIRQEMLHQARVQQFVSQLQSRDEEAEPVRDADGSTTEEHVALDLAALGRALVLDDHAGVRQELVVWLERNGCPADGFGQIEEALQATQERTYDLLFVDLDLHGQDGLNFVSALQESDSDSQIIVMSIPEWLADRMEELIRLGVLGVLTKPLEMDDVRGMLGLLARGEQIDWISVTAPTPTDEPSNTFGRIAQEMRGGTPLAARLAAGVQELVRLTRAELGVLFHLDPDSGQMQVTARAGKLRLAEQGVYALAASPVGDLIRQGSELHAAGISASSRRRFHKLLEVVRFQSCLGVSVPALGQVEHALFLFHRQPDALPRHLLRDAHAIATLLSVALERDALETRLQEASPFLLGGQLATGFGHDVYNKMSALELQVRNLKAACAQIAEGRSEGFSQRDGAAALSQDMQRLLDTTMDLKETAGAFRDLVRAEDRVETDLNEVAQRAERLMLDIARKERVSIELELAPDLPKVIGSPVRLQQVFLNVMYNAIQQTGLKAERWTDTPRKLRVITGHDEQPEPTAWVRFADTGPGIHRRLWRSIFALGFSTRPGGTGLGLFIARSLMSWMGGHIAVERGPVPVGTVMRIDLPVPQARAR